MALVAGMRLGPYEITGPLGAGGMGEVYRARDTRLDRSVAIKVLPAELAADADRRTRFEREARTISTLNHPHICTLHDVGDHDGLPYLVMEHLEGETLETRLKKGPLPLDRALDLGAQIADALSAAHRHGIVHRDLKPANVMLTKAGAKLLDFGLAKLRPQEGVRLVRDSSATVTQGRDVTAAGTLVGTLPYMAPEQVEGREADARTDLWALGCLLYEMVTGRRAFEGTTTGSLVGEILAKEPAPLATRQPLTPPALERLVKRCLAKDLDQRLDSAHDVADELRWIATAGGQVTVSAPGAASAGAGRGWSRRSAWLFGAALAVLGIVAGAAVAWLWRPRPSSPQAPVTRLSLDVRPADELSAWGTGRIVFTPGGSRTAMAWTPDGQALVFVGRRDETHLLYVRPLAATEARVLPHTEGAQAPAVSADGRWIAFWANGAIKKVPVDGGPVVDVVTGIGRVPRGLAWDARGRVVFGSEKGSVMAAPPEGGLVTLTRPQPGELRHVLPWPLPGQDRCLYTVRKREISWGNEQVVAHDLVTGARKVLLEDAADARYVPTGHLVFLRRGVLFAVALDVDRLELRGAPVPVLDGVAQALTGTGRPDLTGAGQFAVASTGALAWVPGVVGAAVQQVVVTVDRQGRVAPLATPARSYDMGLRVSPDGGRLAMTAKTLAEVGLWSYDLDRGTSTPLASKGEAGWPAWTPDGSHVAILWNQDGQGQASVAVAPGDGSTTPRTFVAGEIRPSSWTPDGRQLAAVTGEAGNFDIVTLTVSDGSATVRPLLQTAANEGFPVFSPDGRWLAYASDSSGRWEVYVRPHPGAGQAQRVSIDGGSGPAWHSNGQQLFFLGTPLESSTTAGGQVRMMVVDFVPGSRPRVGRPRVLFAFDPRDLSATCFPLRCYDVSPSGDRFYMFQTRSIPPRTTVTHVNVILNWFEELKAKVPAGN
jgi:serine/threonine-protein kinase